MLDYLRMTLSTAKTRLDERGASAVEYALLITGIAALIITVVFLFGGVLNGVFTDTCSSVGNSAGVGGC